MYLKLQPSVQKLLLTPSVIPNLEQKAITNTAREFMAEAGSISQLQEMAPAYVSNQDGNQDTAKVKVQMVQIHMLSYVHVKAVILKSLDCTFCRLLPCRVVYAIYSS